MRRALWGGLFGAVLIGFLSLEPVQERLSLWLFDERPPPPAFVGPPPPELVPPVPAEQDPGAALKIFLRKLDNPVAMVQPEGEARFLIVEKPGRIRVFDNGALREEPLLDIGAQIASHGEQGLLGLALHPGHKQNRRLFVNFTDTKGDTRVHEMTLDATRAKVEPSTTRELLHVAQPYANHNGGNLMFGLDGLLYIGLGDGGSGGDPRGNGQNPKALLGKMLRMDVDQKEPRPEIALLGLRNPWRYSFDRETGDLYIGDVGQNLYEEIDVLERAKLSGVNLGWNVLEGNHCYASERCERQGMTMPAVEYEHAHGCSVTGGFVYRGQALPKLRGVYLYADFCTGMLNGFRYKDGAVTAHHSYRAAIDPRRELSNVSSFAEDQRGELYLISLTGTIYQIAPR